MTITIGNKTRSTSNTFSHNNNGGELILGIVSGQYAGDAPAGVSATYGGAAMTSLGYTAGQYWLTQWFILLAPASGANDIAITGGGYIGGVHFVYSITGTDRQVPANFVGIDFFTGAPSVTVTTQAGDLVFDCLFGADAIGTPSVNCGQTNQLAGTYDASSSLVAAGVSTDMCYTCNSGRGGLAAFSLHEAAPHLIVWTS